MGKLLKFKARLVAGGNHQKYLRDYDKVFAPVVNLTICLLILIISFVKGWIINHVDVKAAFLNGKIDN